MIAASAMAAVIIPSKIRNISDVSSEAAGEIVCCGRVG